MAGLSRQQRWQLKKLEQGLCGNCGKYELYTRCMCETCAKKKRAWARKQFGSNPWRKGGMGRPPMGDNNGTS